MREFTLVFGMLCATVIVAMCGYGFHFWNLDGMACFWIAAGSLGIITTCISKVDGSTSVDDEEEEIEKDEDDEDEDR